MKKIILSLLTVVVLLSGQLLMPTTKVQAASYSAFDVSKIVFQNEINGKNLFVGRAPDTVTNEMRAAVEAGFLSVYTYQAKNRSDATYTASLAELNRAIDFLYDQVVARPTHFSNAYQSPGTGLLLQASIMMKKFNLPDLTTSRKNKVEYLYSNSKSWLNNAYNNGVWPNNGLTFKYMVENQIYSGTGINKLSPFSANIAALHAGALALDSDFLYKQYGVNTPTSYPHRNTIANIGNYVKEINFGDSTQGRLANVGSARNYVDVGYASWHAMGLAQMAHGTVYTQYFSQRPSSTFMNEADAMSKGFKTVYSTRGSIPQQFYGFASSVREPVDKSEWLYSLTWTGDQTTLTWIDTINRIKFGVPSSQPVVATVAASSYQNLNRTLSGLTGGMLKGLTFN